MNEDDVGDELEIALTEIPNVEELVDEDDIDLSSGHSSMVYELKFSKENIQFCIDGAIVKKVPKTHLKSGFSLTDTNTCLSMASLFRRAGLEAVLKEYITLE